ncbi:HDOD domain-containing protein [Ferrimonas sp. SCSIO 43195]|uniref:HDOD domain-containing protein n=1 Tax=Ferrimonas sp. SCSIO 43195 TaxID=2822844 RepID=UPI002075FFCE|nr:HDOD domain-containing protein [Ferrimonas sp. SCSIO 43195]USD37913.1 HDOD domain-containing protein [Ferrimonas sp. SCSIO 43195]
MNAHLPKPEVLQNLERQFWQYQSLAEPVFSNKPSMDDEVAFVWRHKLAVERAAEFKRIQRNRQRDEQEQRLRLFFDRAYAAELDRHLEQPQWLQRDLGIQITQLELLEELLDDDGDIRRLSRLIEADIWLSKALIRHINSNRFDFRRVNDVQDVQLAINYLGYERLRNLLPGLIFEHWSWSPNQSQGIHQRKLWRWCRLMKTRSAHWLKLEELDPQTARVYSCVFALGAILVHRQATTLYQSMRQSWLSQARLESGSEVYEGVRFLRMPCQPIAGHLQQHLKVAEAFLQGIGYQGRFLALMQGLQTPWFNSDAEARALSRAFGEVVYLTLGSRVIKQVEGLEVITAYYQIPEARVTAAVRS